MVCTACAGYHFTCSKACERRPWEKYRFRPVELIDDRHKTMRGSNRRAWNLEYLISHLFNLIRETESKKIGISITDKEISEFLEWGVPLVYATTPTGRRVFKEVVIYYKGERI